MAKRENPREDVEAGGGGSDGDSACFSDAEEEPWHSPFGSNRRGGSCDEHGLSSASDHEIGSSSGHRRDSSLSDCCSDVDLESGAPEIKVHLAKVEKDCRICQLGLDSGSQESGVPIELGCSCKDDLAAAHRQCAEAWFKIRGNK
ncbi:hypothetical protein ACLOJK_012528 [Asimina triloba]